MHFAVFHWIRFPSFQISQHILDLCGCIICQLTDGEVWDSLILSMEVFGELKNRGPVHAPIWEGKNAFQPYL